MKVGYLGPKGSFSHAAAKQIFPDKELIAYQTIAESMAAAMDHSVQIAIVPIENTIEGTVNQTTDSLFLQEQAKISGEVTFTIQQQLMVHPIHQKEWTKVKKVFSHPQAIAQCQHFLFNQLPQAAIELTDSTSAAAQYLVHHPEEFVAAIGPSEAASLFDLAIVQKNIQDLEQNQTSFWLIQSEKQSAPQLNLSKGQKKMTLFLTLPDNLPGALHKALGVFHWRGINLSRIESRPMKTVLGEYFFLIDIDMPEKEEMVQYALEELRLFQIQVLSFGSYWTYDLTH